ncbi:MAG: hypothetical protein JO061_22565 [Acidobacteriaceae bacterium]|nr:hypothetical protein [Acidobacteriaceae bacterium]
MTASKRPLSVTILGFVYIAVGTIGFAYHATEFWGAGAFRYDTLWIELVEAIAIVCGVFILRGRNWARWLALAWMAFHVVVSAFHPFRELAMHAVLCALIAWLLFRADARRYFRGAPVEPT